MSTRFTIICDTCDEVGPHIRRHHGGALLQESDVPRFFGASVPDEASEEWGSFLIEHEYHELRFETEWRASSKEPELPTKPTYRLMPDGSLDPPL